MSDVELLIRIPEETYQRYKKVWQKRRGSIPESCIAFGITLPKGHGELVDRNAINERYDSIYNDAINCSNQPSDKYLLDKLSMCLDTALPIIEADNEDN